MEQQVKNLIAVSLLAPIAAQSAMAAKKPKNTDPTRPNVIIILADDLGYGDLGCYGAKNVQTPNVDRLAQQGIRLSIIHVCHGRRREWRGSRWGVSDYENKQGGEQGG